MAIPWPNKCFYSGSKHFNGKPWYTTLMQTIGHAYFPTIFHLQKNTLYRIIYPCVHFDPESFNHVVLSVYMCIILCVYECGESVFRIGYCFEEWVYMWWLEYVHVYIIIQHTQLLMINQTHPPFFWRGGVVPVHWDIPALMEFVEMMVSKCHFWTVLSSAVWITLGTILFLYLLVVESTVHILEPIFWN